MKSTWPIYVCDGPDRNDDSRTWLLVWDRWVMGYRIADQVRDMIAKELRLQRTDAPWSVY